MRDALSQLPDDQEVCYRLALCMSRQGRWEEAVPLYDRTLRLEETTVWAYFSHRQLATHHAYRTGDISQAVSCRGHQRRC